MCKRNAKDIDLDADYEMIREADSEDWLMHIEKRAITDFKEMQAVQQE